LKWQKSLVGQDLTMHPTIGGHILMSDLDRILVLYDPQKRTEVWRWTEYWFCMTHKSAPRSGEMRYPATGFRLSRSTQKILFIFNQQICNQMNCLRSKSVLNYPIKRK